MKRGLVAAAVLLAGCAGGMSPFGSGSSDRLLQRADDQLMAAQYRNALALYDEYLQAPPNDAATPRARAARGVVERLLLSQSEVERLRREVDTRQVESDRLKADLERVRREVDTRQAEIDRLKADLERLRRIDLRQAPVTR